MFCGHLCEGGSYSTDLAMSVLYVAGFTLPPAPMYLFEH